uniref:Glucose-methanol-choline oxidoreductase N-terminal domain-containing protein n=1 Tax=Bionectria ochroleuca TaxID=29856 RepID=A0A8H7KCA7_BIOOC
MSPAPFDFVIVGGGTAGLVVASRLSENSAHRVLVLEAGLEHIDDPNVKTPAFYAGLFHSDSDWAFKSEPQPQLNGRSIDLHQGRALGGSSTINAQVFVPPGKHAVDAWEESYQDDRWPSTLGAEFPRSNSGFAARRPPYPIQEAWEGTFEAQGHYVSPDPWLREPTGAFSCLATVDASTNERSYATSAYYRPIAHRNNLKVLTYVVVERIIFEKEGSAIRATGVQYRYNDMSYGATAVMNDEIHTATAMKEVILAAGALQSPKLLELSGVGNARVLSSNGVQVVKELLGVGENLQDHVVCPIGVRAIDGLDTMDPLAREKPDAFLSATEEYKTHKTGIQASSGMTTFHETPLKLALEKLLHENQPTAGNTHGSLAADLHGFLAKLLTDRTKPTGVFLSALGQVGPTPVPGTWLTLVAYLPHPLSLGSVHIRSKQPSENPVIDPKYLSHPVDIEILAHQMKYLGNFAASSPFNKLLEQPLQFLDPASDFADLDSAKKYIRSNAISMWHYVGSCAMLPEDKGGVVDTRLKVHGINNLRIVDSSVVPIITTVDSSGPAALGGSEHLREAVNPIALHHLVSSQAVLLLLLYRAIAVTLCYFASVVVETFALCSPVEFNWDKNIPDGNCEHQSAAFLGAAITNLLIDAFIVALPMPMLFGLRMSLQKRLSIAGMFGLGGIICIISMLRVISVSQWDLDDVTYATTNVSIYSGLEPCLGVVNACLPTIQPTIKSIFGDVVASWSSHDSQGTPIDTKISRNRERQNAQYIRDQNFRRLEDDIPLTTIQSDHGGDSDQNNNGNTITVTRQWEVDSC